MRAAGEARQSLAAVAAPAVSAATGLGTGGGAAVQAEDDPTDARVRVIAGPNAAIGGSVTLKFAAAPPTLAVMGSDRFGTISVTGQGTTSVTISWTAKLAQGEHTLAFEWSARK